MVLKTFASGGILCKMPRECDAENPDAAMLQSEESMDLEVDFVEITPETDLTPITVIPFPEKS